MSALTQFLRSEDGAVTVDWVVLTSGVVVLALIAMNSIGGSIASSANTLSTQINEGITVVTP